MKTTKTEARQNLVINGELLDHVLKGALVIDTQFNGWDWFILAKLALPTNDGFNYGQFETTNGSEFHLMVQRNGSTKKQVLRRFLEDFNETRRIKNQAFQLGNIE